MIGRVILPVGDSYILNKHPLNYVGLNCCLKDSVYNGEFVNI